MIRSSGLLVRIFCQWIRRGVVGQRLEDAFLDEISGVHPGGARRRVRDMTVKHLLEQKGRTLWTIAPDASVLDAVAKIAEKDIGSLVVMDGEES
jgi:CBS domain-containing protein